MKQQQVSVKFSTPRYRALCYYLEKEGKNIEGELQKKLEEMPLRIRATERCPMPTNQISRIPL